MSEPIDAAQSQTRSFGLVFHPSFPISSLPDYAQQAEQMGFDELWLWDDCFLPGAFSAAAIALSATHKIKVCIGLIPVPALNPLFMAMEITSLAGAFPGRFIAGFGHGVEPWMKQIGAAERSSLARLRETVTVVRDLLHGEEVNFDGEFVHMEHVKMQQLPDVVPPLYIGAMREKSLALAGSLADGTLFTSMSSPTYTRWALGHIQAGMQKAGKTDHRVVGFVDVKVNEAGVPARAATRRSLAARLPWADVHTQHSGFAEEIAQYLQTHNSEDLANDMPDAWLDAFSASGTPHQVSTLLKQWFEAGVNSIIIQPLWGDTSCQSEYKKYLPAILKDLTTRE
ncbi:F420-dependent glucose-6-phosphate dehydrogenase [bioreactor metagenome]|uniref:F420-dependent glucose-6-phosphate dehydrogenase n=1 Tax=bioreactor metagenome TaxID=1076179 RepID=A0A644XAR6_9ZZZZ